MQNPKEEQYSKIVLQCYERAQILQEEKVGLVERAIMLVGIHLTVVLSMVANMAMRRRLIAT